MKKKLLVLLMAAVLMMSIFACTDQSSTSSQDNTKDTIQEEVTQVETDDSEEVVITEKAEKELEEENVNEQDEKVMKTIKVYYSDDQAENLVEKQIDIELVSGELLEEKVIESLKVKPEDSNIHSVIDENVKINSVKVEDDRIAKVDLDKEGLSGSSTQEYFLKDAIILTLTDLDSVDKVQFLVDGEVVETLMGHIDVSKPFTRQDVETNIIKD